MTGAFFDTARFITERFHTQWTARNAGVPIVHANEDTAPTSEAFVYLETTVGSVKAASVGTPTNTLVRHNGLIQCNIFVPLAKGPGLALQYADDIADIFRLQVADGISYGEPYLGTQRQSGYGNGMWWSLPVFCPFTYDKVFP